MDTEEIKDSSQTKGEKDWEIAHITLYTTQLMFALQDKLLK